MDVILNAGSGAGADESVQQQLAELFQAHGLRPNIQLAKTGPEVVELAKRAARGPSEIVVAGGGDGTINAVASALAGTGKTLGVLPVGTLNHFAKDLRIPLVLAEAVRTISTGHTAQVDVGEVNGRIFLNNSGLGLYPSIVNQREKRQELGYSKWPAFILASLAVFRRYPFLHVRLNSEKQMFVGHTPFVFIGNNEYQIESLNVGGRACLNAGQLSLFMTHNVGRMGLVRLALRALFGRLRGIKDFVAVNTKEVTVETRRKIVRVSTDGEITLMQTPLHYRIRPGFLRVLVPEPEAESEIA
ncbi:MAG: diacylglycerol kinase family lipid kinase [Acidobacteriota bacterium]|nr:diacylglycerol kinase family lipid kinase [Acidobacteriota bacterium]